MKRYIAIYKDPYSEHKDLLWSLKQEYGTMAEFKTDLKGNGYKIIVIIPENEIFDYISSSIFDQSETKLYRRISKCTRNFKTWERVWQYVTDCVAWQYDR